MGTRKLISVIFATFLMVFVTYSITHAYEGDGIIESGEN